MLIPKLSKKGRLQMFYEESRYGNGILLPKLLWPTVKKIVIVIEKCYFFEFILWWCKTCRAIFRIAQISRFNLFVWVGLFSNSHLNTKYYIYFLKLSSLLVSDLLTRCWWSSKPSHDCCVSNGNIAIIFIQRTTFVAKTSWK